LALIIATTEAFRGADEVRSLIIRWKNSENREGEAAAARD